MKKLAIIGSGEFQEPLIMKAKNLGYETHVFSLRNNTRGELEADYFYGINVLEKEKILKKCQEIKIDGITTIASDITTGTVSYVAEKMNLIGNSIECFLKSTNKYNMRKAFKENGIEVPKFLLVTKDDNIFEEIKDFTYPVIVKPVDRAGSRGVTKVNDILELKKAIKVAIDESLSSKVIVEEYIEGEEYSCECISVNGKHKKIAFTKKFTTGSPHFVETGHIQPALLDNEEEIEKVIYNALDSIKIKNGASHSEFKIMPNNEIRIIEIGARMAGDCIGSHLVNISTGIDYIKLVIDIALGNEVEIPKEFKHSLCGIKFICCEDDYNKLLKLEKQHKDVVCFKSNNMHKNANEINSSSARGGWYIIKTEDQKIIEKIFY